MTAITEPHFSGALVVWEDAFTPAEVDAIQQYGDALALQNATIAAGSDAAIRVTEVAWITRPPELAWLYQRIETITLDINRRFFKFDLYGLVENLQYTVYREAAGGHYEWHVDRGNDTVEPRKISLSVQLSDTDSYQGCDLEVCGGSQAVTAPRKRGSLLAFPSFVLHRVTPIRSGTRKSLVAWVGGPEFR
jgi:PKHD-type hydroxylase